MLKHLWTGGPAPLEYVELILCRDVYHCTPSELYKQDVEVVLSHLEIMAAEGVVHKAKSRRKK